ncbi:hybrid sensor histidine kinase/response regulator [Chitinophaga sp. Ak27]|uniref:ATP-binding response regulator n=1 Tax=Chitinophaga sp. Ak27 TaxID=2726116 RepID=UPI00145D2128|nr:hybrid sensor histidine kinase/response regulator [Chitinophaga sp. Ak27]NLU94903.1 response regulator [Chitinophaga sp. Ak27]
MSYTVKNIVLRLITAGTDSALTLEKKRLIVIVNKISLITALLCTIITTVLWFSAHSLVICLPGVIELSLFLGVIRLNRIGKHDLALSAVFILHGASALYFGAIMGPVVNIEALIVFLCSAVFLMIRSNAHKWGTVILILLMGITLKVVWYEHLSTPVAFNQLTQKLSYFFSFFAVLSLNGAAIYFYTREMRKSNLELEAIIAERTQDLKTANQFKTQYLNETSHDYRVFVQPIQNLSTILMEGWEEKGRPDEILVASNVIKAIHVAGSNMMDLAGNSLDLASIESGNFVNPDPEPFAFHGWLYTTLESYQFAVMSKPQFKVQIDPAIPDVIVSSRKLLTRIVRNLLSNAIKFSPRGKEIAVSAFVTEEGIQINVTDQGPGIAPEKLDNVFDDFFTTASPNSEGTGLGLSIAKRFSRALHGDLTVQSQLGHGTTFSLIFPLQKGAWAQISSTQKKQRSNLLGCNVLVVDDDTTSLLATSKLLKIVGCRTYVAENVDLAFRLMENAIKPELILVDYHMPGANGNELIDRLRKNPSLSHIPVIMITASELKDLEDDLHADSFLVKPVTAEKLVAEISKYLHSQYSTTAEN